ncbi:hypothetical protein BRAS3843_1480007 [Bradyrhizobium sp. STM 3843]|uniref:hypothetical protein n=1 Tax=Bradyrhizobium sp. STM 3843 TaxID=551947 RepID=UPI0002406B92|nr:hypothetical protein [Bradyrhizobium sp. STM 3843]CCE05776.1 hypothetical protein BRAS3843_1480007 [Bradyrhizobium sp. STM 3843]
MLDPKAPAAPAAKAPVVPVANSPAASVNALAIDERFAQLAAQFMAQVNAQLDAFRQEVQTQLGTNVDPLHSDLHELLDAQTAQGARLDKLEAADFVTPQALRQLGDALAETLAPKFATVVQHVINTVDPIISDRLSKIESKLRFF